MAKYILTIGIFLFISSIAFTIPSPSDPNHEIVNRLIGRDKSPNPAAVSYSGCGIPSGLDCAGSHTDKGIQMGECWSNTRVMGQKSAFFVPVGKNDPSYRYEGGPYGDCTAYPCYPKSAQQMQAANSLSNFCFFWDGKDHTVERNGGLYKRLLKRTAKCALIWLKMAECPKDEEEIPSNLIKRSSSKKHDKKKKMAKAGGGVQQIPSSSNGMPKSAPGQVVIPIPMICPSNLQNCYAQTYFEQGGKLQVYANVKPTYQGDWFPPKNAQRQPMFCNGLNRGCTTPTMKELQLQHLAAQHCDVSKCH